MHILKRILSFMISLLFLLTALIQALRAVYPINLRLEAGDIAGSIGYLVVSVLSVCLLLYFSYRFARYALSL
jgi:hypothetical protein